MSAPVHVLEAALDAAFDRYEEASCLAASLDPQPDLFDHARSEAREWLGIVRACRAAAPAAPVCAEGATV